jgi:glutamate dehydrogenase
VITSTGNPVSDQWLHAVRAASAEGLLDRFLASLPPGYDEITAPPLAAVDLGALAELVDHDRTMTSRLVRSGDDVRFRVYVRGQTLALADLLPMLDSLGLRAIHERAFAFRVAENTTVSLHDVLVQLPGGGFAHDDALDELQRAFAAEFEGTVEVDGLNRLVLLAGLTARQIQVLRAYSLYLHQIGFPFTRSNIEHTLGGNAATSTMMCRLFEARFDPSLDRSGVDEVRAQLAEALDAVPGIDDDRTLRAITALIEATLRTNAYRPDADGSPRPVLSFKFDTSMVPDLPKPRPMFEIWVCSPRVEGVHLRNGPIARGGLRWSDRRDDFRTEILGLVKAQIVKNAVIVPTGAKGGFVLKRPSARGEAFRTEGIACYRQFVAGLLDITDNLVDGKVVAPDRVVRYDGDDPYLVVAADKGTATFSDIANEIAAEYDFWLGDAFASGGSVGYDHKAMGITARGAWESVRRHARAIGKDADSDPLTVVGIGDMSGDVFGNGLLRSVSVRLLAAFDHRHIFLDPDPDPNLSFAERQRLFGLPGSSWADYDPALLSTGGAVFPRTQKVIDISAEAAAGLGVGQRSFTPSELISAILRAPVDVLWNGGIGTYVKASTETHLEVGDRANDAVRVNGNDLRCRIVGEGGNLGLTQRARVEYALAGGLVYTDAIDNSAGVDCSDHEVNLKILLGPLVAEGKLSVEERKRLLESMTDEVGTLVLDDNRAQTLALAIARRQALPMVNVHARYLQLLETEGWLDRSLEFLPTDKQIAERQAAGTGLTTPEFAVVMAYTKSSNVTEMLRSDLPEHPQLRADLHRYFPAAVRERFPDAIDRHRLRREIVATQVANQMVNLSGISFDHRMSEETGADVVDVMRAWAAARDVHRFQEQWDEIDALGPNVRVDSQIDLFLDLRRMVERSCLWLMRHRRPPLDLSAAVDNYRDPIAHLSTTLEHRLVGRMRDLLFSREASRLAAGVPEGLAQRSVVWPLLHTAFDVVDLADATGSPLDAVADTYWGVFDHLDVSWLWDAIGALPRAERWPSQARSALRDDLLIALADLTEDALRAGGVEAWAGANERLIARVAAMFREIRRADAFDVTTLSVALRQLRNLPLVSTP